MRVHGLRMMLIAGRRVVVEAAAAVPRSLTQPRFFSCWHTVSIPVHTLYVAREQAMGSSRESIDSRRERLRLRKAYKGVQKD